jgi:2-oxoglutarate ferredoxin oxidoreductase subunit alpha
VTTAQRGSGADQRSADRKSIFVQGNEACARGALAAGLRFFAGYPITPSTEIAEIISEELPKRGGRFIQMEDEIASMAAIIGGSMAGAKSMTATSGPGFSLMVENIGLAAMLETPCVIVNVQRGGPSTGLPTKTHQADVMQARWGSHGDYPIIVLTAASVQGAFDLTIKAFNLAEKYRTPVVLLLEEATGHMREKIEIPPPGEIELVERTGPSVPPGDYRPFDDQFGDVPPFAAYGTGYRYHATGLTHDRSGFPTEAFGEIDALLRRHARKINEDIPELCHVEHYMMDDAEIALVAFGSSARAAKGAVDLGRAEGLKLGMIRLVILWPFPTAVIREAAARVAHLIVPELNMGQMVREVERAACGQAGVHSMTKVTSELWAPHEIVDKAKALLSGKGD